MGSKVGDHDVRTKKKSSKGRLAAVTFSLLLALTFIAVAFTPALTPVSADAIDDYYHHMQQSNSDQWNVVDAGFGILYRAFRPNNYSPSDVFDSSAKDIFALNVAENLQNNINLSHAATHNNVETLNLTVFYFARQAEWGAKALYDYQTANGLSHNYNADWVSSNSQVMNNSLAYLWETALQNDAILGLESGLSQSFVGTYDGMQWGFQALKQGNAGMVISSTYNTNPYLNVELTTQIDTEAGKYVYTLNDTEIYLVNIDPESQTSTVNISSPTANVYTQSLSFTGKEIKAIKLGDYGQSDGRYNFASSNPNIIVFGIACQDIANSGNAYPALIAYTKVNENNVFAGAAVDDGTNGHFYGPIESHGGANHYTSWTQMDAAGVYFAAGEASGIDSLSRPNFVNLGSMLDDMNSIMTKVKGLISTANAFGQSYYNMLVATGGDGNAPMPDIIYVDPHDLDNLTWEQAYAIYIAYLNQQKDWFYNYTKMSPDNVNLSGGSLDLLCRGAIYDNTGKMLYDNQTIWTPYVSIEDWTIKAGQNNTMTQPAFILIWGKSSTLDGFTESTDLTYLPTKAGYNVSVEEMYYKGTPVAEKNLTVTQVSLIIGDINGGNHAPQGLSDLQFLLNHWYWFATIFGIIMLLAWIPSRSTAVGLIGLVLLAVGGIFWAYSDWTTSGGLLSGLLKGFKLW